MIPTEAAVAPPPADGAQQVLKEEDRAGISEAPEPIMSAPPEGLPSGQSVLSREEKVEYRDQDGNLLDEEQVKALEGKVSFKTRYETRTRMVDVDGNEINPPPEEAGVAPPHPDVDGPDSSTIKKAEQNAADNKAVEADESKEAKSETGAAKPASEGNEATGAV